MLVKLILLILFSVWSFESRSQEPALTSLKWVELQKGLWYNEVNAPEKSILNDSKLFILKADPMLCSFSVHSVSDDKKFPRTAATWAKEYKLNVVVNAGMFNMANHRTNKGYLQTNKRFNNPRLNKSYNVMMAMNPRNRADSSMIITDMSFRDWTLLKKRFTNLCQGMRMIDGHGEPLSWDKRPGQSCSMVVGATDEMGNIYFAFTRSPYTHQQMIGFLKQLIPTVRTTVYLEGGPEASLYIQTKDTVISKIGSYVSQTYAHDKNDHFWDLPNVIGIRSR